MTGALSLHILILPRVLVRVTLPYISFPFLRIIWLLDTTRRQLLFEVGKHVFAADIGTVREVVELSEATPVPGAAPGVLGLLNLRGTLTVAAELAALIGLAPGGSPEATVVVCEYQDRRIALRVGRVLGVAPYPENGLHIDTELLEALGASDYVTGVGEFGRRPYYHLDLAQVFDRVLAQVGDQALEELRGGPAAP